MGFHRFKKRFAVLLTLVLILTMGLCACGAAEAPKAEPTVAATEAPTVPAETEPAADGRVTYTIHVQDENGAAIAGAMVQICMDTCLPGMTDAQLMEALKGGDPT